MLQDFLYECDEHMRMFLDFALDSAVLEVYGCFPGPP